MTNLYDFFKERNYVALTTPRTGIQPLRLLLKKGKYFELLEYALDELFEPDAKSYPGFMEDKSKLPNFSGIFESDNEDSGGIGIKALLQSLFTKLIMTKGLSVKYEIKKPHIQSALEPDLDRFISAAKPKFEGLSSRRKEIEDSKIYIITQVFQSKEFTFSTKSTKSFELNSEIKTAKVKLLEGQTDESGTVENTLEYKGRDPMVLGVRAVQLFFNKKAWWHFRKDSVKEGFSIKHLSDKKYNLAVRSEDDYDYLQEDIQF